MDYTAELKAQLGIAQILYSSIENIYSGDIYECGVCTMQCFSLLLCFLVGRFDEFNFLLSLSLLSSKYRRIVFRSKCRFCKNTVFFLLRCWLYVSGERGSSPQKMSHATDFQLKDQVASLLMIGRIKGTAASASVQPQTTSAEPDTNKAQPQLQVRQITKKTMKSMIS